MDKKTIHVIGAGLAGSEAAWQIAQRGINVVLYEMRGKKTTPAHSTDKFAELVCSNSLRSDDKEYNAVGLMHEELRQAGSLIMEMADLHKVPAGGALAVDREGFSEAVTEKLKNHPLIKIVNDEITELPDASLENVIIATGPLTSDKLAESIKTEIGGQSLSFYDAIAPVVYKESIDFEKAWYQSRYDKGDKFDYINCPMTKDEYNQFIDNLLESEKAEFHEWENAEFFEGCLPIEVMASRGRETLTFGPMKPVGLTNPHDPENKPYAIVQLRQDNKQDTLRNIVGFQTKMKYGEQKRILRMIPGLENVEFARLGGIHRNTFIKSPVLLDKELRLKTKNHIRFAGQITGCEGYVESASTGFLAGYFASCEALGIEAKLPADTTALGAMLKHITIEAEDESYQPMNINFGIFPTIAFTITENGKRKKLKGRDRKLAYTTRALNDIKEWLNNL